MKDKILTLLRDFTRVSAGFLPVILLVRVLEYFTLQSVHNLPAGSSRFIFYGLLPDTFVFLSCCLVALLPYLLLGFLSRKAAAYSWLVLIILYSFFSFALIKYFSITLVPLDQVVFSYTIKEMVMISESSARFSVLAFLPFLLLFLAAVLFYYFFRKMKPGTVFITLLLGLMAVSPFALSRFNPKPAAYERDLDYFLTVNKPVYLAQKCRQYLRDGVRANNLPATADAAMLEQFKLYHSLHPEFSFVGPTYALLHKDETPDVLGPCFSLGKEPPNLVFVIVESLSSAFCGDRPYLGSYTPFIDSLARCSLYWTNCLSTSERTFYVLPAMFASLPYGSGTYLENLTRSAYNLSLIRYLNDNGYTSRFFYGGDPSFNQMDNFLNRNNTAYILTSWGPGYSAQQKAESGFKWGYPDNEMFRRSFEVTDSMNSSKYIDIYLTLSMHAPFVPPMAEKYGKRYEERLNELKLNTAQRAEADQYRDIYTTILYTDDAVRNFFREYAKRPAYSNTIFFITGDHSLPELNTGLYSPMERFRVPFIIWSPMLKQAKQFRSVISHLDVTPSVLAMLRDRYGVKTHPLAHWLGTGFDTSAAFRCDRSLVFLRNNKEMTDFVDGNYCLSAGRLYRIRQDMTAVASREPQTTQRLQKKLDNFVAVTEYVGKANAMIPIWMMFSGNITEHEVPVNDSVMYNGLFKSDGFISVVKKMKIPDEYKYVTVSIRFKMLSQEPDPEKLPQMVFDVTDSTGHSVLWNQYPLSIQGTYKPGQWVAVSFNESMDLSYIHHPERCEVKLYLWNTSGLTIGCDSLTRKISGFK